MVIKLKLWKFSDDLTDKGSMMNWLIMYGDKITVWKRSNVSKWRQSGDAFRCRYNRDYSRGVRFVMCRLFGFLGWAVYSNRIPEISGSDCYNSKMPFSTKHDIEIPQRASSLQFFARNHICNPKSTKSISNFDNRMKIMFILELFREKSWREPTHRESSMKCLVH